MRRGGLSRLETDKVQNAWMERKQMESLQNMMGGMGGGLAQNAGFLKAFGEGLRNQNKFSSLAAFGEGLNAAGYTQSDMDRDNKEFAYQKMAQDAAGGGNEQQDARMAVARMKAEDNFRRANAGDPLKYFGSYKQYNDFISKQASDDVATQINDARIRDENEARSRESEEYAMKYNEQFRNAPPQQASVTRYDSVGGRKIPIKTNYTFGGDLYNMGMEDRERKFQLEQDKVGPEKRMNDMITEFYKNNPKALEGQLSMPGSSSANTSIATPTTSPIDIYSQRMASSHPSQYPQYPGLIGKLKKRLPHSYSPIDPAEISGLAQIRGH